MTSFSISFLCQFIAQTFTNRSCKLHLFETSDQLMSSKSPWQPLWCPYLNFKSLQLEQVWEILNWSDDVFIWFMDGNGLLTVRLQWRFSTNMMETVDTGNSFDFLQEVCQYIIISLHYRSAIPLKSIMHWSIIPHYKPRVSILKSRIVSKSASSFFSLNGITILQS